jgi:hypothetical protein
MRGNYIRIAHLAVFFQDAEIAKLSAMLKKAEMKTSSLGMSWQTNVAFTLRFRTLVVYRAVCVNTINKNRTVYRTVLKIMSRDLLSFLMDRT